MFESDQQLYEIICCACTAREEEQWRISILDHAAQVARAGGLSSSKISLLSFENSVLCLDIKPLGPVFGQPGTLMRRQSIQRASTTNHRRNACQVIIKNTFSLKETGDSPVKRFTTLSRSRSLMSTNHIPLLTPRRGDRQRMEQKMLDVWTKDRLPYPGMTGHRGGHLIRTSATSVMRKISLASTSSLISPEKRRRVTQGSWIEDQPDSTSFACPFGSQIDGTSSLRPQNVHSYSHTFWSNLEYRDPNPYTTRISSQSREGGEGEEDGNWDANASRQASETSTVLAGRSSKDLEGEERNSSKPRTLLKAFSTESIRGWFH